MIRTASGPGRATAARPSTIDRVPIKSTGYAGLHGYPSGIIDVSRSQPCNAGVYPRGPRSAPYISGNRTTEELLESRSDMLPDTACDQRTGPSARTGTEYHAF